MGQAVTITFVSRGASFTDAAPAEGLIRMPDDTLRPFSGWIDLLAALEDVAVAVRDLPTPAVTMADRVTTKERPSTS